MKAPTPASQLIAAVQEEIERREAIAHCEHDFVAFCKRYFGATPRLEDVTPAFHLEISRLATDYDLPEWINSKGKRKKGLVLAAPRGHSKTTILTFCLTMWWICYRKKRFVILANNSAEGAAENVTDIRDELINNEMILRDFGNLCGQDLGYKWTQSDFVAIHRHPRTGKVLHRTRVVAKSPGAKVRGIKDNGARPDALIVDDLENDESVESPEQITKVHNWLNKAAIPTLDPRRGTFIMVGTMMHFDAVLARMLDKEKYGDIYVQRVYRAYWSENGRRQYLWPERFTPELLEMERKRLGSLAFNCEYLNDPIDPETRAFQPQWLRWYYGSDLKYERGRWWFRRGDSWSKLKLFQGVDPAIKEKEQQNSDFFAHVTIGVTEESDVLMRAVVLIYPYAARMDFPAQVQRVIQQFNAFPTTRLVGIEMVAYQMALKQELLRRELMPIMEIEHNRGKRDKIGRITALGVLVENGQFYMRAAEEGEAGDLDETLAVRVHHSQRDLYDDMVRYPRVAHDDRLDALEMAISLSRRPKGFGDYNSEPEERVYTGAFTAPVQPQGPGALAMIRELGFTVYE